MKTIRLRHVFSLIALIASIFLGAIPSQAATYYIDPDCTFNGNGSCNGTEPSCTCAVRGGAAGPYNKWPSGITSPSCGDVYKQKAGTTHFWSLRIVARR